MNNLLNLDHKTVTGDELDRLLNDNPDILATCEMVVTEEEENENNIMHRTFCCKSSLEMYLDVTSGDTVAVFLRNDYVENRTPTVRLLLRLRIGNTVYNRKMS